MSCVLTADRMIRSLVVILLSHTVFSPRILHPSCRCLLLFTFMLFSSDAVFSEAGLYLQHLMHKDFCG